MSSAGRFGLRIADRITVVRSPRFKFNGTASELLLGTLGNRGYRLRRSGLVNGGRDVHLLTVSDWRYWIGTCLDFWGSQAGNPLMRFFERGISLGGSLKMPKGCVSIAAPAI